MVQVSRTLLVLLSVKHTWVAVFNKDGFPLVTNHTFGELLPTVKRDSSSFYQRSWAMGVCRKVFQARRARLLGKLLFSQIGLQLTSVRSHLKLSNLIAIYDDNSRLESAQ